MVSTYGYATLANLEKYAFEDYSKLSAVFSDANIEAKITDAEKYINGYVGTIFTGTIPPDIELATKMITKIFLDNHMKEKNIGPYEQKEGIITNILEVYDLMLILDHYRDLYNQKQGIFIGKHTHAGHGTYALNQRPTGW